MCQRLGDWFKRGKEIWRALLEAFWVLPVALMGAWAVAWLTLYVDTPPDPFLEGLERAGIATPAAILVWAVGVLSMFSGDRKEIRDLKASLQRMEAFLQAEASQRMKESQRVEALLEKLVANTASRQPDQSESHSECC